MRWLALTVLVLLVSVAPVWAGSDERVEAYEKGDHDGAVKAFLALAEKGNPVAQYYLAMMYRYGEGVPKDYVQSATWLRNAAEQGHVKAQFFLAISYQDGQGVAQDYAQAATWYRKAAEQGDEVSQNNLGVMYIKGRGVPQDFILAHMWLNLAASKGMKDAAKSRDNLARRMTPDQIAEAQKRAREWKPKKP